MPRKKLTAAGIKQKIDNAGVQMLTRLEIKAAREFGLIPGLNEDVTKIDKISPAVFDLQAQLREALPQIYARLCRLAMYGEDTPSILACKELRAWHAESDATPTVRYAVVFDPIGDLSDVKQPKAGV